jgi:CubicO group peptidase (beta-lactamase class C family)
VSDVQGNCDSRFDGLREVFASQLASGEDLGASLAVRIDDQPLVDLWGGWADEAKTTPWQSDTLVNVWSTTKTMTNLCALILHDRGLLNVYDKVSTYWPEFAANGKENVEVRHLLSHTSGVSGWEQPITVEDIYDREASTASLATQAPWWEPGSASGYHAQNQGHLVGEVVRRVTGRTLGQFFADDVAGPLGADFHIGLDPKQFGRVSNVIPPPPLTASIDFSTLDVNSVAVKTFMGPMSHASVANSEGWRRAEIGAANGHGNARSVALVQSAVANGGSANGVKLLSPETIKVIFDEQANGIDLVLGVPLRFGIGYGLPQTTTLPFLPDDPGICFWGGYGGSMIIVDTTRKMTFAYMMNRMSPGIIGSATSGALITAAYKCLS